MWFFFLFRCNNTITVRIVYGKQSVAKCLNKHLISSTLDLKLHSIFSNKTHTSTHNKYITFWLLTYVRLIEYFCFRFLCSWIAYAYLQREIRVKNEEKVSKWAHNTILFSEKWTFFFCKNKIGKLSNWLLYNPTEFQHDIKVS